jgi:hypothetical protein
MRNFFLIDIWYRDSGKHFGERYLVIAASEDLAIEKIKKYKVGKDKNIKIEIVEMDFKNDICKISDFDF